MRLDERFLYVIEIFENDTITWNTTLKNQGEVTLTPYMTGNKLFIRCNCTMNITEVEVFDANFLEYNPVNLLETGNAYFLECGTSERKLDASKLLDGDNQTLIWFTDPNATSVFYMEFPFARVDFLYYDISSDYFNLTLYSNYIPVWTLESTVSGGWAYPGGVISNMIRVTSNTSIQIRDLKIFTGCIQQCYVMIDTTYTVTEYVTEWVNGTCYVYDPELATDGRDDTFFTIDSYNTRWMNVSLILPQTTHVREIVVLMGKDQNYNLQFLFSASPQQQT